jgi:multimeric flavodoxin WrbA
VKIIGFNGGPRKKWNTALLLENALEGARSQAAETELVHLYDLDYKGCISCFACKTKGGKSYGKCVVADGLKPIFKKIEQADALVFGSPIYLGNVTGEMRSFLERLVFQYLTYTEPPGSLFSRPMKTGVIYTMGVPEEAANEIGYGHCLHFFSLFLTRTFGHSESLCCYDTLQFDDYSKYVASRFDPDKKAKRRKEVFPEDCRKAFELGRRLAGG